MDVRKSERLRNNKADLLNQSAAWFNIIDKAFLDVRDVHPSNETEMLCVLYRGAQDQPFPQSILIITCDNESNSVSDSISSKILDHKSG